MKLAKLEMVMMISHLVARFEFELSDRNGNPARDRTPPWLDRNEHTVRKAKVSVYLRYKRRFV